MPEDTGTEEKGSTEQESEKGTEGSDDIFGDARKEDALTQSEQSGEGKAAAWSDDELAVTKDFLKRNILQCVSVGSKYMNQFLLRHVKHVINMRCTN